MGPDLPSDDSRDLALRRVAIEALHEQNAARQEVSRSRSRFTILAAAAVTVGVVRSYVFWHWETFSPEAQDALRIGWFVAFPLLVLVVAIVVARIGTRPHDNESHSGIVL